MKEYPLYDVPYLVRGANESYMSVERRRIRERNQAVVDAYFVERDKGASAPESRAIVAAKYQITEKRVKHSLDWFYHEALKRKRYDFLEKFPPQKENINRFDITFAADLKKEYRIQSTEYRKRIWR